MKCDYCDQPGTTLIGESNEIVVCWNHVPSGLADRAADEAEVESLRQQHAEAEWLLRMTMDARDRAERRIEAVEALADKLGATPDWNMSHRNVAQSIRTALGGEA